MGFSAFRAALLVSILAAGGCQSSVQVHAAQSPAAHFERYRTVALDISPAAPADDDGYSASSPESAEARAEIRETAARVLEARGYALADKEGADLVLRIEEGRRHRRVTEKRPAPATGSGIGTSGTVGTMDMMSYGAKLEDVEKDLVEGAFAIDAFDGQTNDLVWKGSARAEIRAGKVNHGRLRRAVESVLRSFPAAPPA
jgi:hypothetical protein